MKETVLPDDELLPHPDKRPVYSSTTILDRRARILRETRRMLGESGIEGLSIRELCKRSNVALRTLYNAFQSKDRLVAIAIRDSHEQLFRDVSFRHAEATLDGLIERMTLTYRGSMAARNFTRSLSSLYFAAGLSPDIWVALQSMVLRNLLPWLRGVEAAGELMPSVSVEELGAMIANLEFSTSHDWAQRRIPEDEFVRRLISGVLRLAAGSMTGAAREDALRRLRDVPAMEALALPSPP